MEREIDTYEEYRPSPKKTTNRVQAWKDAWYLCMKTLENFDAFDFNHYHLLVERWIPLINKAHGSPITQLHEYDTSFYYLRQPVGPKEIMYAFFGEVPINGRIPLYIIFNVHHFKKIFQHYCALYSNTNQMNVDLDRGTVNLWESRDMRMNTADFFKINATFHFLFILLHHMMAHIDVYEKMGTARYHRHDAIHNSTLFKLRIHGKINHVFTEIKYSK